MDLLLWFEATAFSTWMRESGPAFFSSLVLHSVAMGFLVGVNVAADLSVLGAAPGLPLPLLRRFDPVARAALVLVTLSGVLLLIAYPTKALTNPLFYLKLSAVAAALLVARSRGRRLVAGTYPGGVGLPPRTRVLAAASLVLWAGVITSGRLLAYTYDILLAAHRY